MSNIFSVICPTDCSVSIVPALPAQTDCIVPSRSEIDMIIFRGSAVGPTDMSMAADWVAKIDNTEALGAKMKYLIGIGTMAAPEDTTQTGPRDKEIIVSRLYTLVFTISNITSAVTYDFLRKLQCGNILPNIYYTDLGGFLYGQVAASGPDNGIEIASVSVAMPKDAGKEGHNKAILTFKWSSKVDPDRVINPLTI